MSCYKDANNERVIINNLQAFYEGRTVIIVAHRLTTVKNADKIVVFDHGKKELKILSPVSKVHWTMLL